jgi:hypothetical protein
MTRPTRMTMREMEPESPIEVTFISAEGKMKLALSHG